jgi:DNA-binding NtrC family response regulator
MTSVLIVDDDSNLLKILEELLVRENFEVETANDVDKAVKILGKRDFDLILTDLMMPGKSGIDLLAICKEKIPTVPVIMLTAYGNIEAAVSAIKNGAYDFITKPFDQDELINVLRKALSESQKNRELISAYFDDERYFSPEIIGMTDAIQHVFRTVKKIAKTDSTVLITGETGVGKELIARTIHLSSGRRNHSFVKVNCAAIPETLIESELFGHEKGAFTGAVSTKPGRFEIADGGTLFLDEIGETPLQLQVKLLSVLQDWTFERVGGVKTMRVDVRVIAATNKDLKEAVESGTFRSDLFYRLNVVPIHIPSLRERKDDIFPQIEYFLKKYSTRYRKESLTLSADLIGSISNYDWPGNTRELENAIERMVLLCEEEVIGHEYLPEEIKLTGLPSEQSSLKDKMDSISRTAERQMILDALKNADQNRTRAAKLLGISRRTLQKKIKEYGL